MYIYSTRGRQANSWRSLHANEAISGNTRHSIDSFSHLPLLLARLIADQSLHYQQVNSP